MSAVEAQSGDDTQSLSRGYATFFWMFYSLQAVFTAYFPVYCVGLGFSALQTAIITSAENLANLVGPVLATKYLYRLLSPRGVVLVSVIGVFLLYFPMVFLTSFAAVLTLYFLMSCANKTVITAGNAAAVKTDGEGKINYGRVRIWGSIGFVAATYLIGSCIDSFGAQAIILCGLVLCSLMLISIVYQGHVFGEEKVQNLETQVNIFNVFSSPALRSSLGILLIVVGFGWASHAVFFTYFSVFLGQLGWSGVGISTAWTVAVVGEIIVFYYFDNIATRISIRSIFIFSLWVSVLRWGLIGTFSSPSMIILTQALHAFSFGSFYLASMKLLNLTAPKGFEERAMGYFSAVGPGIGLALGRLAAGGGANLLGEGALLQPLFFMAAALSAVGALYAHRFKMPAEGQEKLQSVHGMSVLVCDHGECP